MKAGNLPNMVGFIFLVHFTHISTSRLSNPVYFTDVTAAVGHGKICS